MPTRLLDVGIASSRSVRLVLSPDPRERYAALSYCWGKAMPLITTSKNVSLFQVGFLSSSLPKTFADAVKVTQHLGIRYLWIDALCIVQDESEDWLRGSASMASVYGNADATIVSSRASSSMEGFLSSRHEVCVLKKEVDASGQDTNLFLVNHPYYYNSISGAERSHPAPLSKRAWVIQKRYLSRRKILFGEVQWFWECNETTLSEDTQVAKTNSQDEQPRSLPWDSIVERFTKCDITYESDTFPAISGIAKTVAHITGGTYCAGIWINRLCATLLWFPESAMYNSKRIKRTTYVAPSFSWAAAQGPIIYPYPSVSGSICDYVSHGQTLRVGSADPYGAIDDAWIKLKAPVVQVLRVVETEPDEVDLVLRLQSGENYVLSFNFDHEEAKLPTESFILPLKYDEERMQALVVTRTSEQRGCMAFCRIGTSNTSWKTLQRMNCEGNTIHVLGNLNEEEKQMKRFMEQVKNQIQIIVLV